MMNLEKEHMAYYRDQNLSCTVLELDYRGNASALLILPDEDKMPLMEAALSPELVKQWRQSLRPKCGFPPAPEPVPALQGRDRGRMGSLCSWRASGLWS